MTGPGGREGRGRVRPARRWSRVAAVLQPLGGGEMESIQRASRFERVSVLKTWGPFSDDFFKTFPPFGVRFFKTFPPFGGEIFKTLPPFRLTAR